MFESLRAFLWWASEGWKGWAVCCLASLVVAIALGQGSLPIRNITTAVMNLTAAQIAQVQKNIGLEQYVLERSDHLLRNYNGISASNLAWSLTPIADISVGLSSETPPGTSVTKSYLFTDNSTVSYGGTADTTHTMEIDPSVGVLVTMWVKADNGSGGASGMIHAAGFKERNEDGGDIFAWQCGIFPGTTVMTTTTAITPGTTTQVKVASGALALRNVTTFERQFRVPWTATLSGRTYPVAEYSNRDGYNTAGQYDMWRPDASGVPDDQTINLTDSGGTPRPWPALLNNLAAGSGGVWPIGTQISVVNLSSGTYRYSIFPGTTIPTTWTKYQRVLKGGPGLYDVCSATRSIALLMLPNYSPTTSTGRLWVMADPQGPLSRNVINPP